VGAFLIFNTLSMTVSERVRELGLLRAAGATRRQLVAFVGVQAVVLGILGSALGLVAGFVLAELMAVDLRTIGSIPFERVDPFLVGVPGRLAGLPFRSFLRVEERLARASIIRDRSRTTLTVGALAIGLAMVVAVGGVAHQSRLAASAWLAEVIPGDELVTSIR